MRRALITGVGIISPLGEGRTAFFDNLIGGRSAITPITGFDTSGFDSHLGGEVRDFKPETYLGRKTRGLNRTTRFLTAAIKLAVQDAGLTPEETSKSGVVVGTGFGNSAHAITYAQKLLREGPDEMFPLDSMDMPSNSSVNFVSVFFGFRDFARTISAGFTSSHDALGNALQLIRKGRARRVIVAGMEQLSPELFTLFYERNLLTRNNGDTLEAPRPFDQHRNGFALSEGGYALVVEEGELTASRKAKPMAELTGFANGFVGNSNLSDNDRLERMSTIIKLALENASTTAETIDLIHAAANGSQKSDFIEARLIERLFGQNPPAICSIKGQMGEVFGASGVMQAAIAALSLASGKNPSLNLPERPDPDCWQVTEMKNSLVDSPQKVIINGHDLAGNYSCLILEKYNQGNSI